MSAEFLFTIPKRYWMSANDRPHWADKATRTKHLRRIGRVFGEMEVERVHFRELVQITAHIGYATSTKADPANANPTVKALLDGLVEAGVFIDDDDKHVIGPDFRRDDAKAARGTHTVRLVVEEVEAP